MNLDLTGLAEATPPATGEPLMVPLEHIGYDPDQPRKRFEETALRELAESIRAIGVVQPISLRRDPTTSGRYIINYGERRYRASVIAGMQAIPAFLHKAPSDYTQITENLHHADLSPMEIALFIKRRMDAGEKKHEIAARLGYKNGYVTEHLALLEAPPCVEKAYANGATSARTLYDLRRLHDKYPQEVDAWCASGVEVTRDSVAALFQKFRRDEILGPVPPEEFRRDEIAGRAPPEEFRRDEIRADALAQHALPSYVATLSPQAQQAVGHEVTATPCAVTVPASTRHRDDKRASNESRAVGAPRLFIKVEYGGHKATIQDDSVVLIRYDDGGIAEVRLADTVVVGTTTA